MQNISLNIFTEKLIIMNKHNQKAIIYFFASIVFIGCKTKKTVINKQSADVNFTNPLEKEIGFITHNKPFDIFSADGVYNHRGNINQYNQKLKEPFFWDDFSIDFDFLTHKYRNQWPIITKENRAFGIMLKEDKTIAISTNNQNQVYSTEVKYQLNKWHHIKVVKNNQNVKLYLDDQSCPK